MIQGLSRTYQLAKVLVISQLRTNRSNSGKSRIWERPTFILVADTLALALAWFVSFEILSVLPGTEYATIVNTISQQVLAFVPIFVLALVLLVGIMFELNASSRFTSSDLVNWLPISRSEYVTASAVSVAYDYSPYLFVAEGIGLALSIRTGLFFAWIVSLALSIISLFAGGLLIEILRASINRVYSAMSKKTGRATLILRLAFVIVIIVAFQAIFNPNLLFNIMSQFVGVLDASFFVPLVWPSLSILSLIAGEVLRSAIFAGLTLAFVISLFTIAVAIRSKYWAPNQIEVSFGNGQSYVPRPSRLAMIGFSPAEASILSKDLKAYVRKKELVAVLALPFVFTAVIGIQKFTLASNTDTISWLVAWFAGFAAIFLSATSIGTEGKSFLNMYLVPLESRELLRAKAAFGTILSVLGALVMSIVATLLFGANLKFLAELLALSVPIAIQSVLIGLCFATRDSDFVDRPRPRYVSTWGMLKAMILGFFALAATALPILLLFSSEPYFAVLITLTIFSLISYIAYRYSLSGARALMIEMRS
jgi:hypothetical protein